MKPKTLTLYLANLVPTEGGRGVLGGEQMDNS